MHIFSTARDHDPLPLLDEEFDKIEMIAAAVDHTLVEPILLCDDLAWDDQIDNGDEMSL